MSETSTLIGYSGRTIGREELALVPTPPATETHRPIPHHEIVQALIETLGFRHIGVVHDEYAVSPDGMKAFGVLDLATEMEGCRFSIGLRNSHDKSMRLAMTCGYRVFVCSNMAFSGDFTPVLAKHSKSFSLIDCISVQQDLKRREQRGANRPLQEDGAEHSRVHFAREKKDRFDLAHDSHDSVCAYEHGDGQRPAAPSRPQNQIGNNDSHAEGKDKKRKKRIPRGRLRCLRGKATKARQEQADSHAHSEQQADS